jgi:hypothetical protein
MTSTPITDRLIAVDRMATAIRTEHSLDELADLVAQFARLNSELRQGLIERANETARLRQQVWDLECELDRAHGTIAAMREHPSTGRPS